MLEHPPIDLARYPLDDDSGVMRKIIDDLREQLDADQYCSLPGFFTPEGTREAAGEALSLIDQANPASSLRNCYLQREGDGAFAADHPRNVMNPARYRMIAADLTTKISTTCRRSCPARHRTSGRSRGNRES